MNQSWRNNLKNSPGFVYFNTSNSTPPKTTESSDFIPFNEPSPQKNRFDPVGSSSPNVKNFQNSPRPNSKNWRHSNSFGGSSSQFYSPNKHQNNSRNSSFSSYNSSFNDSWNGSRNNSYNKNKSNYRETDEVNISKYLHPSFMEDPWAALEKQHKIYRPYSSSQESSTSDSPKHDSENKTVKGSYNIGLPEIDSSEESENSDSNLN